MLFQRFQTSIPEEIYSFVHFHAGGSRPDPQVTTPLDPRMNKRPGTRKQCSYLLEARSNQELHCLPLDASIDDTYT